VTERDVINLRATLAAIRREVELYDHQLIALAAKLNAHKSVGMGSMAQMVARESGVSTRDAAKQIKLAEHLEEAPILAAQMTKPGMSTEKARIVAGVVEKLPLNLTPADRERVEADLAQAAPSMSVEQLRRKARRAVEIVDREQADRIENRELLKQEAAAIRSTEFWMTRPDDDGMVQGGFVIDALTGDMLRAAIEAQTSPRRRDNKPETLEEAVLLPPSTYKEKAGAAFASLMRHLPTDCFGNHGGVAATLMVTVDEKSLRGECERAGLTEFGTAVSASQLRQVACGAGILPAVLNGDSQVLDLGRESRLHNAAQRKALAKRDLGCAFPDCDRAPGWAETHHIVPWSTGGPTTIDNGVLLCSYHHRTIHATAWEVRLNQRDRMPDFYPPGSSMPIRNSRYRPLVA
jgi:hypothetical protein